MSNSRRWIFVAVAIWFLVIVFAVGMASLARDPEDSLVVRVRRSWDSLWYKTRSGPLTEAQIKEVDTARRKWAEEQDATLVKQLYSTKPVRRRMGRREYVIPANYFTPRGKEVRDSGDTDDFGFYLFLPDFEGYTKDNWRDPFDRRRIEVIWVRMVDKTAMAPSSGGTLRRIPPEAYGDPIAGFRNVRGLLEDEASLRMFGLEGYRNKGRKGGGQVTWTGTRSNGEFFFFHCTGAPDDPLEPGILNPLCQARYYSEKEDLEIAYRYSQTNVAKWREIDDAIWQKLKSWRVK